MDNKIEKAIRNCVNGLFSGDLHLSDKNLAFIPSKDEIICVLDEIKKLFYPKYFNSKVMSKDECEAHLERIAQKLLKQVELAFSYEISQTCHAVKNCDGINEKSLLVCENFINKLPEIFALLTLDIQATLEGDPAARNVDTILLTYPGIEAIFTYRLANLLYKQNVPIIPRIMTEYAHSKTGIDIHPGATIGKSFVIDHGTGIVIGETTEIGDYVKIYQGVTLGAISLKNAGELVGKKRHPTLKNNVTIYSGATVLGGNTVIGEGATIGSSAFVTKSVDDGVTVAIEKPKLRLYVK